MLIPLPQVDTTWEIPLLLFQFLPYCVQAYNVISLDCNNKALVAYTTYHLH